MTNKAHRHGDARICGASTVVTGQNFTYVNGKLWAVVGDPNTDGDGALIATQEVTYINGKLVIVHSPDPAAPDDLCIIEGGDHCLPATAAGSENTYA